MYGFELAHPVEGLRLFSAADSDSLQAWLNLIRRGSLQPIRGGAALPTFGPARSSFDAVLLSGHLLADIFNDGRDRDSRWEVMHCSLRLLDTGDCFTLEVWELVGIMTNASCQVISFEQKPVLLCKK